MRANNARQLATRARPALCGAPCCASSSRLTLAPPLAPAAPSAPRRLSLLAHRPPGGFFTPPPPQPGSTPPSLEDEVDDREWEMRVARGMLHLRETLPLLFDPAARDRDDLFPPDVYSKNVTLKLPAPLPFKVSSLHGYTVAFGIARNGMQALHTDLKTSLERMSVSPVVPSSAHPAPAARQRQIRILLTIHGRPRLPPHHQATWHTSSLYSFSPYSGLIAHHEVETIRPLPGEGVAEWLRQSLFGFAPRKPELVEEPVVYPRASASGGECGGADGMVRSARRDE